MAKKVAPKKAPAKKAAPKKGAKKAAPKKRTPVASSIKPVKERMTKTGLIAHLSSASDVSPKEVKAVLGALEDTILGSVVKRGAGEFMLPGLVKIVTKKVPARKARMGIVPFTGEEKMFPAKPASVKVKARALSKLNKAAKGEL